MAKVSTISRRMENTIALMKESVEDEMLQKLNTIHTELPEETRPLVIELEKDMEVLLQMYATNEYHMRDVVDSIVLVTEKARYIIIFGLSMYILLVYHSSINVRTINQDF